MSIPEAGGGGGRKGGRDGEKANPSRGREGDLHWYAQRWGDQAAERKGKKEGNFYFWRTTNEGGKQVPTDRVGGRGENESA